MRPSVRAAVSAAACLSLLLLGSPALRGTESAGPAGVSRADRCERWMALTFDDGPSAYRSRTLRILRSNGVPATFFDVGLRVAANPHLTQFEAREGHLVLNHTWSHPRLPDLTPAQVRRQVSRAENVLAQAGAPQPFRLLRPPFGDLDAASATQVGRLGYAHVTWDVVAPDWDVATTSDEIRDTIVTAFRPGLVILMHDGAIDSANGPADIAALPQIVKRAHERGYCFGLLDERGAVVPAQLRPCDAPIPRVVNPVPYLPLGETSRGTLPPAPYVVVDPASQL